jgi:hypothetical protein
MLNSPTAECVRMWNVTQDFLVALANWLVEAGSVSPGHGPLVGCFLGLYQPGTPVVGPRTPQSAIVEASYDGYARQEIVWYPTYVSTAGPVTLEGGSLFFQPSDSTISQTISGIFISTGLTGGDLYMGQALPTPGVVLSGPLTILKVIPEIQLPFTPTWGGAAIFS